MNNTLLIERISASTNTSQNNYKFKPSKAVIPVIANDEIDIDIFPSSNQKNIAQISGRYQGYEELVDRDELHGLPLRLHGAGSSLAEKMSFQLKGEVDKKGKFNLFLTGLATTVIKLKLTSKVFPTVEAPIDNFSPEVLCDEVFRKIGQNYTSGCDKNGKQVPGLQQWCAGLWQFWERYGSIFQMDMQKDVISRFDQVNKLLDKLDNNINLINQKLDQLSDRVDKLETIVGRPRRLGF